MTGGHIYRHLQLYTHRCEQCDKIFRQLSNYKRHTRRHQEQDDQSGKKELSELNYAQATSNTCDNTRWRWLERAGVLGARGKPAVAGAAGASPGWSEFCRARHTQITHHNRCNRRHRGTGGN